MIRRVLFGLVLVFSAHCQRQIFVGLPLDDEEPLPKHLNNEQNVQTAQPIQRFSLLQNPAPVAHHLPPTVPQRSHTKILSEPIVRQEHLVSRHGLSEHDIQTLNSVSQPQNPSHGPSNVVFGVEEPTLRATQHAAPIQKPQTPQHRFIPNEHQHHERPQTLTSQPQNAHFSVEQPTLQAAQHAAPNQRSQTPRVIPQQQHRFLVNEHPQPAKPQPVSFGQASTNRQQQEYQDKIFKEQAANAKYSFASQIDDSINGNQFQREEVRDGLAVKGMYSYSDGYVRRTVFYEADDKGYRVVKEEEEPLGDGPQVNPNGHASVSTYVAGNQVQYSITSADIQEQQKNLSPTHF